MKNMVVLLGMVLSLISVSAEVMLPKSLLLKAGDVMVRLDSRKFCNINRIVYKKQILCIDTGDAHYGTVCNIKGSGGFVGSGHTETGHKEKVLKLEITIDDQKIDPMAKRWAAGKKVCIRKQSKLRDFMLDYKLIIENNVITENVEISSEKDVELVSMYHFMHPWSTEFTRGFCINKDGDEKSCNFSGNNRHPFQEYAPILAWFDPVKKSA